MATSISIKPTTTHPDGTIHPYDGDESHKQTDSEYATAQCWLETGDPGPDPDTVPDDPSQGSEKFFDTDRRFRVRSQYNRGGC